MRDAGPLLFLGLGLLGGLLVVMVRHARRPDAPRRWVSSTGPPAEHGASRFGHCALFGALLFLLFETALPAITTGISATLAVLVAVAFRLLSDARR